MPAKQIVGRKRSIAETVGLLLAVLVTAATSTCTRPSAPVASMASTE
ncbi:hypothetical protein [Streptomyces sp. NPDC051636]